MPMKQSAFYGASPHFLFLKTKKNIMKSIKLTVCALSLACFAGLNAATHELQSPDGNIVIKFSDDSLRLKYEVAYKGKAFIESSKLGLNLQGASVLGQNVQITAADRSQGVDSYTLVHGRSGKVEDAYNALTLKMQENDAAQRKLTIEARAYNDAVAFRYVVPEQMHLIEYNLVEECTEFCLAKDATAYALVLPNFKSGYESEYHKLPVSALANQGGVASHYIVGMPVLLDMPGVGWGAIIETDLEGNAATYLTNPTGSWMGHKFTTVVSPSRSRSEVAVASTLPHHSPWRVIMLADEPGRFGETNVVTSLNPENRIADTSWISAGLSSWDWWNGSLNKAGEVAYTTETMKYYVDFAAENGFKYMTIDAGWCGEDITKCRDNVNVPEVVAYAKSKGVKVFIWLYSRFVWNQMEEAFPLYEKWGVAGLKIDFIERNDQAGIDWYYRVAEKAAEHHLMVDYHGCTNPWGLQRTYPNVVGYEAILGMEQSKAGGRDNPDNRVALAFTRMIPGLMDYTPGGFDNVTPEEFVPNMVTRPQVMGTRSQHLALYVVYDSPFQMVSDWPEAYRGDRSFDFIKEVPARWDETRVLNGTPDTHITVARRNGNDWWLGAITGWTPTSYKLPLDFLGEGSYTAVIYRDTKESGDEPKQYEVKEMKVTSRSTLDIDMARGGGIAVKFVRR